MIKEPMSVGDPVTYEIIGCCMAIHNELGNGFQEFIYQRCLEIELKKTDLQYEREVHIPLYYKGRQVGKRRADFVINQTVLVELKARIRLEDAHLAQGLNYLKAYRLKKGLLINFGAPSLEYKLLFQH